MLDFTGESVSTVSDFCYSDKHHQLLQQVGEMGVSGTGTRALWCVKASRVSGNGEGLMMAGASAT